MGSTAPKIDFECWKALDDQAKELCRTGESLTGFFEIDAEPPNLVVQEYIKAFRGLLSVIDETRKKCGSVMQFIEHDFGNNLTPMFAGIQSCERGRFRIGLPILRNSLYVNRLVKHVIGSMKFFVDGQLELKKVSLIEFFSKEKRILEKALHGKVKFHFEGNYSVLVDEDTLGTLLMNMAKNARKHGEAENLKISIYWDGDEYVTLLIEDDGKGIDSIDGASSDSGFVTDVMKFGVSRGNGTGIGLADMEGRLKAMGGSAACLGHGGIHGVQRTAGAKFIVNLVMG